MERGYLLALEKNAVLEEKTSHLMTGSIRAKPRAISSSKYVRLLHLYNIAHVVNGSKFLLDIDNSTYIAVAVASTNC